jgi:predicted kinase
VARSMAIAAARVQLLAGRDVVVPQYLGRIEFVLELEQLARQTSAGFVEIALTCDPREVAGRFHRRSTQPQTATHLDAAQLLERSGGPGELHAMSARLEDVLSRRPQTVRIESVDGRIEDTYTALVTAIETQT